MKGYESETVCAVLLPLPVHREAAVAWPDMDVRLGGAEVGLSGMCWNVRARGQRPVTSCRCSSLRVLRGFADIARFGCPLGSPTISFVAYLQVHRAVAVGRGGQVSDKRGGPAVRRLAVGRRGGGKVGGGSRESVSSRISVRRAARLLRQLSSQQQWNYRQLGPMNVCFAGISSGVSEKLPVLDGGHDHSVATPRVRRVPKLSIFGFDVSDGLRLLRYDFPVKYRNRASILTINRSEILLGFTRGGVAPRQCGVEGVMPHGAPKPSSRPQL
ncbi:hypothetical protein J6590_007442 [Homalodisca vitripennis]|nr:hypothetical protein J6590_007442 [Homalodisca vitripennis]